MTLVLNGGQNPPSSNPPSSQLSRWPIPRMQSSKPYLIKQVDLAKKFGMSVDALTKLLETEPLLAAAKYKQGTSQQSPVHYFVEVVEEWLESKKVAAQSAAKLKAVEVSNDH